MFGFKKEKEEIKPKKSGGIAFFITLICLIFISLFNLISLPSLFDENSPSNWLQFIIGVVIGLLIAEVFIVKHFSVACHELKHYLLAAFAGNKFKELCVKEKTGHYTYSYTKDSAKYNAMIALAPYWFPLMTIFAAFLAVPIYFSIPELTIPLIGIGVGADLLMNMRDISPHQTDLTYIRGGFKVALAFIISMNLTILTLIAAWVSQGLAGFKMLFSNTFDLILTLYLYFKHL
ncbi:MAG: hypothetical protein ACOX2O_07160 [Bdellovibrionota bacterium]|jgi:hypothetical protein